MGKNIVKITSDHAGHNAKMELADRLENQGYQVELFGSKSESEPISYAEVGAEFAKEVKKDLNRDDTKFVAFCGSGIGISMALNRFKNIRCARVTNEEEARLSKAHNNSNILCMGGRLLSANEVENMFHTWENTEFEGGRHIARINRLDELGQDE
ncbi:RpiB/LacA/LacB family sugar-phosphate isomerase [Mycoplasmopsis arginini]|uniref:RpiB/LacA/LacB family sugar-phosphate isomerase n=1 Tax=Mycoplasmopsis arginini TaxID=2094 RepID=UPI000D622B70|nr:RpiB/LacA/LacB family sugar-phosphate isomerase [Mycoplasmopsis arginini]PWC08780.1 RpiB/LacA/LacB family sugar-phosphate isomerase [Mycoplasmopsis arginini]